MNVSEINKAILTGNFTSAEMASIVDALKMKRSMIAQHNRWTVAPGQDVTINSAKHGVMQGKVLNVKRTKATVLVNGMQWLVPLSMLA
jgi:hypothetical protein